MAINAIILAKRLFMEVKRKLNERYKRISKIAELISNKAMGTQEIASVLKVCVKTIQRDFKSSFIQKWCHKNRQKVENGRAL